ncbi:MAG: hypothetical protein Q7T92_00210 [Lutibacter sp.]|nr:hypothetical protein [Lutibacter sp.]
MKNSYCILPVFLVLFNLSFVKGNAQQLTDETTYIINEYFQLNKEASLLLENKVPISSTIQSQDNFVKLNQIGDNNQVEVRSKINDSQTVNQFGNNNDYLFINYYNSSVSNFNILQQGNSNSLQIYGENSLIKNISIVQKANFETLIIKNY